MSTITTEWSTFEWDGGTRLRFLGAHSPPTTGPWARKLARYIGDDGTPLCVTQAVRDDDGWFEIEPGSLTVEVGQPMRFVHADPDHPVREYHGTLVVDVA